MQAEAAKSAYWSAKDIMKVTGCGRTQAYEVISRLNTELEEKGFITFRGRAPRKYVMERLFIIREMAEV